jgi:membrane protease YdiL (CAAX protease family)
MLFFVAVAIIVSWLLLWLIEKKNPVEALGLKPGRLRVLELLISFFVSALVCAILFLIVTFFSECNWSINKNFSVTDFFAGFGWMLRSVLLEELLFRGALLYIAINRLGLHKACILSAIAFGIYHWFSYGVWGNPVQMIIFFILTGVGGLMFAYAFAKTKSIYLPVGLHLGWNICGAIIFSGSNGPLGEQFLVAENAKQLSTIESLINYLYQVSVLPLIVWWYLKKFRNNTGAITS